MFTGIVETTGHVVAITAHADAAKPTSDAVSVGGRGVDEKARNVPIEAESTHFCIVPAAAGFLDECRLGDSIAVNGILCVGKDMRQSDVNLERALLPSTRLGGHFVQGHVDTTCQVLARQSESTSLWLHLSLPADYAAYIVPKGFVCLDGISLTVCEIQDRSRASAQPMKHTSSSYFCVMLVEYTQAHVTLAHKQVGDLVNLEVDVLAKYVARSLNCHLPESSLPALSADPDHEW